MGLGASSRLEEENPGRKVPVETGREGMGKATP